MELMNAEEVRFATAALASGSGEALDRLVWSGVFGAEAVRARARQAVLDQARSTGLRIIKIAFASGFSAAISAMMSASSAA